MAAYKSLSRVERAFRNLKTARLKVRPVYLYSAGRVRAHVFLCTLACHVEWHLRRRLAPLLFEDDDPEGARAQRTSPVQPARTSERARRKSATRRTAEGLPVHSLSTLLDDLATLALNTVHLPDNPEIASPWPPNRPRYSNAPSSCSTSIQGKCSQYASTLNNANSLKRLRYPPNWRVKFRLAARRPNMTKAKRGAQALGGQHL